MQGLHAECTRVVRRDSRRLLTKTVTEHIGVLNAEEILDRIEDAKQKSSLPNPPSTHPLECLCLGGECFWNYFRGITQHDDPGVTKK